MKKFNKTLAIALAAGLSIGGVTVPIGDAGNSFGFGVASASATEGDQVINGMAYKKPGRLAAKDLTETMLFLHMGETETGAAQAVHPGEGDRILSDGGVKTPLGTWERSESAFIFVKDDPKHVLSVAEAIQNALAIHATEGGMYVYVPFETTTDLTPVW